MNVKKWIEKNCNDLTDKRIVISGATGGIGIHISTILASLNANLVFLGRDSNRTEKLKIYLQSLYPNIKIDTIDADLSSFESVKNCVKNLKKYNKIDAIIHNAGIYNVPIYTTDFGFNNVFSVNFLAPYYITKQILPLLEKSDMAKVVIVGSIAHNYSHIDVNDIDFSTRKKPSKIYGNSKRFLMFSMYELFRNINKVKLSISHPGITSTNMTNHYPKFIYAIIKYPMKIIFMSPQKACLSIIKGLFDNTDYHNWIGPKISNIWGSPKKMRLKTCTESESKKIFEIAENIYNSLTDK